MKTKNLITGGAMAIAFMAFTLTECKKDQATAPDTNTNTANAEMSPAMDDANASYAAMDSKNISDAAVQSQSGYMPRGETRKSAKDIYGSCVTVWGNDTVIGGNNDTVVYIDFGGSDCACRDNRDRRGTIIVYWGLQHPGETKLQAYSDSGNTITQTFKDYYLKDNGIVGTRTWTNEGHNVNGYQNWTFTANLTINYPNNQNATWNAIRNNALAQVGGVWYYDISGSAKGVSRDGVGYSLDITSPVYITVLPWWLGGCPWPESGIVTITRTMPAGSSINITVNYGTLGTCSGDKTVTINGKTTTFAMW
jgi:hypothetical protein